jgi:hypothetical protein
MARPRALRSSSGSPKAGSARPVRDLIPREQGPGADLVDWFRAQHAPAVGWKLDGYDSIGTPHTCSSDRP